MIARFTELVLAVVGASFIMSMTFLVMWAALLEHRRRRRS
jgi:hypothetical protein